MSATPLLLSVPSLPKPETWIARKDVLRLAQRTRQWLFNEEQAGRLLSRETAQILPNGRNAREYALSTLPAEARRRYEAEQAALVPVSLQTELPLFGRPQLVSRLKAPRLKVPAHKMSEAQQRHNILTPILAMANPIAKHTYATSLHLLDGKPVDSQNRMIAYQIEQAAQRGVILTERTVKRWLAAHKSDGVAGLSRRERRDAGRSRFFSRTENQAAAALVAYLYLGDGLAPGLSVQACHDMLCAQRELVGLAALDLPHYDTVRSFLQRITPALKVFATRGRKEFGERMLPYLSRSYTEPSNKIWVSDTMIADVEVLNDCIPGAPLGAPIRLRLTAIIDYRSRYVVGYSWAWEGSSASIATALRHAVGAHGPCELWYCDNGKDYCKVAMGAVPGYMRPGSAEAENWADNEMRSIEQTGVLARLGIHVTHCLAHHPQSKHVERFFRTLHLTFCKLWPTYTGGKPSERPDQTTALMAVHRRAMRQGDLTQSHHPLASQFIAKFEEWLPTYHNKRGHRGQGMSLSSPAEVFAAQRNPEQRPAPSQEELVWLLWEHTTAKVRECQVRVNKHDYAPTDAWQSRLLLDLTERTVSIAYDPLDPSRIAVLDSDGRLLTMLEAKRLVRQAPDDPDTQAQIAAMQQQRGALVRSLREDHTTVIRAGKLLGVQSPLQLMATTPAPQDTAPAPTSLSSRPERSEVERPAFPTLAERIVPRKPRSGQQPSTTAPRYAHDVAAIVLRRKDSK